MADGWNGFIYTGHCSNMKVRKQDFANSAQKLEQQRHGKLQPRDWFSNRFRVQLCVARGSLSTRLAAGLGLDLYYTAV